MVTPVQLFAEGFTLGISTGLACLATCGPIYTAYLMQQNRTPLRYISAVIEMSLGRFLMYILIGAVAGLIGKQVDQLNRDYFTVVAYLLFSIYLLISVFRSKKCEGRCEIPKWNRFAEWPVVLGFITGINVCPSFMLAFSRSFVLSGPVAGMMFFAAFFIGTSLFLVPLSFVGMLGKKKLFRDIARVAAILVAVWFITSAVKTGITLIKPHFDNRPVINLMDDTPAYILLADKKKSEMCAGRFALNRNGKITLTDSVPGHSGRHYVFTDSITISKDSLKLRRPDCFVAVVNDRYLSSPDSIDRAISFLKQYHFRFDSKKGVIFFVK